MDPASMEALQHTLLVRRRGRLAKQSSTPLGASPTETCPWRGVQGSMVLHSCGEVPRVLLQGSDGQPQAATGQISVPRRW